MGPMPEPFLKKTEKEMIGDVKLYMYTDKNDYCYYRAVGPNGWSRHGCSSDGYSLFIDARRICIRHNMRIQE